MKVVIAMAAIGWAGGALAAPTYLTCSWENSSGTATESILIDEDSQRATVPRANGLGVVRTAVFSPTEVKIIDDPMIWIINRVDLSFRRTFSFLPADDPGDTGKCKLADMPLKRAF